MFRAPSVPVSSLKTLASTGVDVIIVGAGPSGLMAAIELKRLDAQLDVLVLEKASAIGTNHQSGAILETNQWTDPLVKDLVSTQPIKSEQIWHLTRTKHANVTRVLSSAFATPHAMLVSLPELCNKMASEARRLGVLINVSCEVTDLIKRLGIVVGVELADGSRFSSRHVFLAEGPNGSVTDKLFNSHNAPLRNPHALCLKEEWTTTSKHNEGNIYHTFGWPFTFRSA